MIITVLVAGTNEPSNSNHLADAFVQGIEQVGSTTIHKKRLKNLQIEHFTVDVYDPQCKQEEDFCMLQNCIQESHGLVIATPVWNFGVPAHLKNVLDRMGSFALDETRSKGTLGGLPFYLLFTGGAPTPAWKGLMQKTTSFVPEGLQYFGASYIGHHFEPKCTVGRGKFGLVVDQRPESLESVRKQGYDFALVVQKFEETGEAPIKHRAKSRFMGWGEAILKKIG